MKKITSLKIATVIIVIVLGIQLAIFVHNKTAGGGSSESSTVTAKQTHEDLIRYGRIVLSTKLQSFPVGTGESFRTEPVEDYVRAIRVVNGNIKLGEVELIRSATIVVKRYPAVGRVMTDGYYAADSSEIGKSIVFAVFPEGQEPPKRWSSIALATTAQL
jgi:hypothetical protein